MAAPVGAAAGGTLGGGNPAGSTARPDLGFEQLPRNRGLERSLPDSAAQSVKCSAISSPSHPGLFAAQWSFGASTTGVERPVIGGLLKVMTTALRR